MQPRIKNQTDVIVRIPTIQHMRPLTEAHLCDLHILKNIWIGITERGQVGRGMLGKGKEIGEANGEKRRHGNVTHEALNQNAPKPYVTCVKDLQRVLETRA